MKQTALVIGGSGDIGSAVVRAMADQGMAVWASYYGTVPPLADIAKDVHFCQMDLGVEKSVKKAFKKIFAVHSKIDTVVFSATAPVQNKKLLELKWPEIQKHLDVQLKGMFNVIQALKRQISQKSRTKVIVILTEYCVGRPPASLAHYLSAKYSLMGFAKAMAVELPRYNWTINLVSPGMVESSLISSLPAKLIELAKGNNPLKRIGQPDDVAKLVLFLASAEADYLNGAHITLNGGSVML